MMTYPFQFLEFKVLKSKPDLDHIQKGWKAMVTLLCRFVHRFVAKLNDWAIMDKVSMDLYLEILSK